MIVDVFTQPYELLVILYGGLAAGLIYELVRFVRQLCPRHTPMLDLLFLLLGGCIFCLCLLFSTRGELRWYAFAGFMLGMWLSKAAFRRMFTKICQKIRKNQYPQGA